MTEDTSNLTLEQKVDLLMAERDKLQRLLDQRDIRDVIARYSRAAERADVDLFKSCFHPDAIDHHPPYFEGTIEDFCREAFEKTAQAIAERSQYFLDTISIEFDGDTAYTETHGLSPKLLHERSYNGNRIMQWGGIRYLHRFEKRDGVWKISEVWFIPEWSMYHDVQPQTVPIGIFTPPTENSMKPFPSLRNKEDLSYTFGRTTK